jgi:hypothetical protein
MEKATITTENKLRMTFNCTMFRRTKEPGYEMMSYVDQELTVEDMLSDPIVQTLMRYDGVSASDVRHTIDKVNRARRDNTIESADPVKQKPPLPAPFPAPGSARMRLHGTAA